MTMRIRSMLGAITLLVALGSSTTAPASQQQSGAAAPAVPPAPPDDGAFPARYAYLHEGSIPGGTEDDVRAALPFARIELERTVCFGACPAYTVTLERDGQARYVGQHNASRQGHFVGSVDAFSFGRLCFLLERQGFTALKPDYSAPWTDDSTCYLRVWRDLAEKPITVRDYGDYGPIELWGLQEAVDAVGVRIEWKPDPKPR
jgi:hypothetical protein